MTTAARAYAEVIGDPVEHSKSPLIHGLWLERLGIEADYRRTRVVAADLHAFIAARRADPLWRGCNVTMPLKLEALKLADECSEAAVQAGAANCLVPRAGRLLADNTDIVGVQSVVTRLAPSLAGGAVTLLGAGGAARAVLVALKQLGTERVIVQARDRTQAAALSEHFKLSCAPQPFEAPVRTDGLINATPLGMTGASPLQLDLSGMPPQGWVFDLVSAPARTMLRDAAESRGLAGAGGVAMLVEQAAAAFSLFFGVEPPRDPASEAELQARLAA